jgi:hypothetical protein
MVLPKPFLIHASCICLLALVIEEGRPWEGGRLAGGEWTREGHLKYHGLFEGYVIENWNMSLLVTSIKDV